MDVWKSPTETCLGRLSYHSTKRFFSYFTLLYKYFMNFANENVVLFYIYFPSRLLLIHSCLA